MKQFIKKTILILFITLVLPVSVFAFDFGLIANVYTGFGNKNIEEVSADFKADLLPRFSMLIGDDGEFFLSAGLTFGADDGAYFVPELLRTEFSMRFGNAGVRLGRITYSDPLSFIANGLFDGVQGFHNSPLGSFKLGLWYTGLVFKKTASIGMTLDEQVNLETPVDYSNFADTYFAPSRMIFAFDWGHPSIAELINLQFSIITQFDLTGADTKLNTQYFTLKAGFPIKRFLFEAGGSLGFFQSKTDDSNYSGVMFAGDF